MDVGSGSGISSEVLENHGHFVLGVDLSLHMLKINYNEKFSKNENSNLMLDLVNMDIGEEWPFKEECFDYAISMSVIQWLFQSYQKSHIPTVRIKRFFKLLYNTIKYGAVLQFYCSKKEIEVLMQYSKAAGFEGGLQIDNEGTKNQKYFLVLSKHSNKKYNIDKKQKKRSEFNIEKNKYKGKRKFMRNKKRNKNWFLLNLAYFSNILLFYSLKSSLSNLFPFIIKRDHKFFWKITELFQNLQKKLFHYRLL